MNCHINVYLVSVRKDIGSTSMNSSGEKTNHLNSVLCATIAINSHKTEVAWTQHTTVLMSLHWCLPIYAEYSLFILNAKHVKSRLILSSAKLFRSLLAKRCIFRSDRSLPTNLIWYYSVGLQNAIQLKFKEIVLFDCLLCLSVFVFCGFRAVVVLILICLSP